MRMPSGSKPLFTFLAIYRAPWEEPLREQTETHRQQSEFNYWSRMLPRDNDRQCQQINKVAGRKHAGIKEAVEKKAQGDSVPVGPLRGSLFPSTNYSSTTSGDHKNN